MPNVAREKLFQEDFDEKLAVQRVLAGETEAFRTIIHQYQQLVGHIVFRMVAHETDREELCQEIFIKVYQNLQGFKFQAKLSTWIGRIAYNTCINFLKKKKVPLWGDIVVEKNGEEQEPNAFLESFSTNAGADEFETVELQAYLDKTDGNSRNAAETHLSSCEKCRQALEAYRMLYTALANESAPALSPNFASAVLAKIAVKSAGLSQTTEWALLGITVFAGLAITVFLATTYFADAQLSFITQIINEMKKFSLGANMASVFKNNLLFYAVAVLMIIWFVEKQISLLSVRKSKFFPE